MMRLQARLFSSQNGSMSSLSPPQIAFLIAGTLSVVGLVYSLFHLRTTYAEYEELAPEARSIARSLRGGDIFRDGDDLVMSGNYGRLPVIVRFSNSDNTPGLSLRVQAPATFTLAATPTGGIDIGTGRLLPTGDALFDSRFSLRSEQPNEARIFLSRTVVAILKRLCCSSK